MTHPRALLLSEIGLPPLQRKLLRALAWAYPAPLHNTRCIEAIWPDPDSEPEYAAKTVGMYVHHLRAAGWAIITRTGVGYVLTRAAFDRLTLPIEQKQERTR